MEALDQEICTSLEEQMQQRWSTVRLEEDWGSYCQYFVAQLPDQILLLDLGKE